MKAKVCIILPRWRVLLFSVDFDSDKRLKLIDDGCLQSEVKGKDLTQNREIFLGAPNSFYVSLKGNHTQEIKNYNLEHFLSWLEQ